VYIKNPIIAEFIEESIDKDIGSVTLEESSTLILWIDKRIYTDYFLE